MRNKSLFVLVMALTASSFMSCEFLKEYIPQKVTIKTNPEISASLGTASVEMSEFLTVDTVRGMISSGDETGTAAPALEVYGFEPTDLTDPTMRFLIKYPLAEMSVDLSSELNTVDFGAGMTQTIPAQTFTVPSVSFNNSNTFSMPEISVGSAVSGTTFPLQVPEYGEELLNLELPGVNFSLGSFTSVSFATGSIMLSFPMITDGTAGYSVVINSVKIQAGAVPIAEAFGSYNLTQSPADILIDLSGETVPSNLTATLNVSMSGGSLGTLHNLNVAVNIQPGYDISGGEGFTISDQTAAIPENTIDLGAGTTFVSAVVGTGSLTMNIDLPSGLTGITTALELTIAQTGGLTINGTYTPIAGRVTIPLDGKTINGNPITVSGNVIVSVGNVFELNNADDIITVDTAVSVSSFYQVVVDAGSIDLSMSVSEAVPLDLKDMVSSLTLSKVGLNLSLLNGLPGNAIDVTVNSSAFGMKNATHSFVGGASAAESHEFVNTNYIFYPSRFDYFDVDLSLVINGYDSRTGHLTLQNITAGTSFDISASADVVFEWSEVTITPSAGAAGLSGTFPAAGESPIDLSMLGEFLGDSIQIEELPVYLYLSSAALETLTPAPTLEGAISASWNGGVNTKDLLGTADVPASILFADKPVLTGTEFDDEGKLETVTNPTTDFTSGSSAVVSGFADVFNAAPADLRLTYDMSLSSITLTKEQFVTLGTIDLSADMYIELPFKLGVIKGKQGVLDITQFLEPEDGSVRGDLFGRTEFDEISDEVQKLLDALTSVTIGVKYINTTGLNGVTAHLKTADGNFDTEFTLNEALEEKEEEIILTRKNLQYVIKNSFIPLIEIDILGDGLSINKGASLSLTVQVKAVTDLLEYTIEFPWCDNTTSLNEEEVQ